VSQKGDFTFFSCIYCEGGGGGGSMCTVGWLLLEPLLISVFLTLRQTMEITLVEDHKDIAGGDLLII